MRLDNCQADCQTEAEAVGFGRVERLEDAVLFRRLDAGATILYPCLNHTRSRIERRRSRGVVLRGGRPFFV
jgi:hypothetical protein